MICCHILCTCITILTVIKNSHFTVISDGFLMLKIFYFIRYIIKDQLPTFD